MRRQRLAILIICIVAVSVLAGYLLGKNSNSDAIEPTLDSKLIGSWFSENPPGTRIVFHEDGSFSVTDYGRPLGPVGKWSAKSGKLTILWFIDDDDIDIYSPL